jgi:hypothetical protein
MLLTIIAIIVLEGDGLQPSELPNIVLIVFVYGTVVGFPAAWVGLVIAGIPLALLLRGVADRTWMLLGAVLLGAAAGRVLYLFVDHAIFFGNDDLRRSALTNYGFWIGGSTGLLWLVYARRVLSSPEETDQQCTA